MANETVATSINELSSIAIAEAKLTMLNQTDLSTLLTRMDCAPGNESVRFPKFGAMTAAALTDGSALSNQEVTTTGVLLSPSVLAGSMATITDLASHNAPQLAASIGRAAGMAIVKKRNADIWALFDGFSHAVGSAGADISEATILAGVKSLKQHNAMGDIFLCITPEVLEDLWTVYSTNTNNTSDNIRTAILAGEQPPIYGCKVVLVTSGISEAGDIKCGMFTRDALGYAVAREIFVEITRSPSVVGWSIVASSTYAVGEIDDDFGVEVLVDGAD